MLTREQYTETKTREKLYERWSEQFKRANGWTVIPKDARPPVKFDNADRSALEVFEFVSNPPTKYFLYIKEAKNQATTWTGEELGGVQFGREFRDNFGGVRRPVTIRAINGRIYSGTFFKSAGDYARVREIKKGK